MTNREKAECIVNLYTRENIQANVATKLNVSLEDVRRVLHLYNYEHTKKKTPHNLNAGQTIRPVTFDSDFEFLTKYPASNFIM